MLNYLETYSLGRVSVMTTSLGSLTSSSNLLSVWHCVSDSFRCCTKEWSTVRDSISTSTTLQRSPDEIIISVLVSVYTFRTACLPARMLWADGRTCGRCRWWQRCRRWWCPESLSTTVGAAQDLFFLLERSLHPSSAKRWLPSHLADCGNVDYMESSIRYLGWKKTEGDEFALGPQHVKLNISRLMVD